MWIKTRHLFSDDNPELFNIETGFAIYYSERDEQYRRSEGEHGVWLKDMSKKDDKQDSHCLYLGTEQDCIKVFNKFCQKLGVHNEVSPDKEF